MKLPQCVKCSPGSFVFCALFSCIIGLAFSSSLQAAPVTYDELIDGDFAAFGALPILPFDIGLNTVRGNLGFTSPGPTDYDSLAFSIPANAQVLSAVVTLTDDMGNIFSSKWRLRAGSNTYDTGTFLEEVESLSPGSAMFTTTSLGPNTYNLSQLSFSFVGQSTNNTANYEFAFRVVEAVPEPSTIGLAAFGLLSLVCVARRQKHQQG